MQKYEIVIIGAGPAGLKAAEILAKAHKTVLVLEKNKKIGQKPCGGGLTLKDFVEFNIPIFLIKRFFKKVKFHTPHRTHQVKSRKHFIATIEREELGEFLARSAKEAGAEIRTSSEAVEIKKNSVILKNQEKIQFEILVGADGSNSLTRKYLGLPEKKLDVYIQYKIPPRFKDLEIFLDVERLGSGYFWIFPNQDYDSIGVGGDQKVIKTTNLKETFKKWLKERNINVQGLNLEGAPVNFDYQGHEFGNIYLVGDAAGFASGLTGEGIYAALKSGEEVAKKILDKEYKCPGIEQLLKIKKIHERILKFLDLSKPVTSMSYDLLYLFFKNRFREKIEDVVEGIKT